MRKIIHDCDCTFGINGCDVDDGLALLYLLGDPEAEVLGVTTTYGNNTLEKVYENTKKFVKKIGHDELRVYKGGAAPGNEKRKRLCYHRAADSAGRCRFPDRKSRKEQCIAGMYVESCGQRNVFQGAACGS